MSITELLSEMRVFISHSELESSIFRSNHASNYLSLEGVLNKDKQKLLEMLDYAISNPKKAGLRPEWMRGL